MAIPKDILAVPRPKSTVVKQRGKRFVVIKRTSRRVGKRVLPVDLEQVGEIIDGAFVECVATKPVSRRKTEIKDYGEVALCHKHGRDLFDEIAGIWDLNARGNMVLLGAAAPYLEIEFDELEKAIKAIFGRKGDAVVETNIKAIRAGRDAK